MDQTTKFINKMRWCAFLLDEITNMISFGNIDLYGDDDLGLINQAIGTHIEELKKKIMNDFNNMVSRTS